MWTWIWAQAPTQDPLPFYALFTGALSLAGTVIALLWKALNDERRKRDDQTQAMLPLAIKFTELTPDIVEATEKLLEVTLTKDQFRQLLRILDRTQRGVP